MRTAGASGHSRFNGPSAASLTHSSHMTAHHCGSSSGLPNRCFQIVSSRWAEGPLEQPPSPHPRHELAHTTELLEDAQTLTGPASTTLANQESPPPACPCRRLTGFSLAVLRLAARWCSAAAPFYTRSSHIPPVPLRWCTCWTMDAHLMSNVGLVCRRQAQHQQRRRDRRKSLHRAA